MSRSQHATVSTSAAARVIAHLSTFTELLFNSTPQRSEVQSGLRLLMGGNFERTRHFNFHHEPHSFEAHTRGASPRNLFERTPLIKSQHTHAHGLHRLSNRSTRARAEGLPIRIAAHAQLLFARINFTSPHAWHYYFFIVCPTRAWPSLSCGV